MIAVEKYSIDGSILKSLNHIVGFGGGGMQMEDFIVKAVKFMWLFLGLIYSVHHATVVREI